MAVSDNDEAMTGRGKKADAAADRELPPAGQDPVDRQGYRQNEQANKRRVSERGDRAIEAADLTGCDSGKGPTQGGQERKQGHGIEGTGSGSDNHQHADEADQSGGPAPPADNLAQERD